MSSAARISPWFVCLASALLPACGAKSGLEQGPPFDAGVDAFAFDARVDAFMPDAAPECRVDGDCSDRIDCTDDRCVAGSCTHTGVASRCDDGLFCNGGETCSTTAGCVSPGRVCDDTVMCTVDICDEARDRCAASPDDTLCPVSFRCDGDRGCLARALVHDSFNLYEVDLPGGDERLIGRLPLRMTDIALAPDGTIYGADGDNLVRVDIDPMMFTTIMPVSTAFIGPRLLATASGGGIEDATLVEIALDGSPSRTIGIVTGFQNIWGLAPRGDLLFGFTAGGEMMRIDVRTGTPTLIVERVVHGFWGAAAR